MFGLSYPESFNYEWCTLSGQFHSTVLNKSLSSKFTEPKVVFK